MKARIGVQEMNDSIGPGRVSSVDFAVKRMKKR